MTGHDHDPRLHGVLTVIGREHETAYPWLEEEAIRRGLAWRHSSGQLYLTPAGKAYIAAGNSRRAR